MRICIVHNSKIPVTLYGGIERIVWDLGAELKKMGHNITFLVPKGSLCPFADVVFLNPMLPLEQQVPGDVEFVHLHFQPEIEIKRPHLITVHGNLPPSTTFFTNTSFVSQNHALRYGADAFVYNGLNWENYGMPALKSKHNYVHFLGKAAWRVKNVKGAIKIAQANRTPIKILGGTRLNFKMGFRFTTTRWATFYGMVGGEQKLDLLSHSKALIFPVLWNEPFGLAVIESLYSGCPVFGTKYGALPELVKNDVGFLSNNQNELSNRFKDLDSFDRQKCHEYAADIFNAKEMAKSYLELYSRIL
ncbi:MAG TPA: glycosyltransferase, partial [Draconibacterium sp.]|nr:glycosyltransferase [Draconibacterium sp.]